MRPALLFCGLLLLLAAPARAQETPPALAPQVERALWCGAAFGVTAENLAAAGETEAAGGYREKASTAFTQAAVALLDEGMTGEDFAALAEEYAVRVMAPFREQNFTEAECDDAIAEGAPPG